MVGRRFSRQLAMVISIMAVLCLSACGSGDEQTGSAPLDQAVAAGHAATPTITGSPVAVATVGDTYVFQAAATDPQGQTLTFSAQGLPSWATLDAGTGRIVGAPAESDVGETADIVVAVSNGKATAELPAFRIKVNGNGSASQSVAGNSAPVISGTPTTTVSATEAWTFTPVASDADTLTLAFAITNKPSWASFSTTTGTLSGTPSLKQVGKYSGIRIVVTDGAQQASLPAFDIQVVAPANAAPTIAGAPPTSVQVGGAYSFSPVAADPEKQALGFSIANKPSWASFNTATGSLTGSPAAAHVGTFASIVISVTDGTTQAALPAFSITVAAAANGQPTITGTPATTVTAGAAYAFQPGAQDPNGDALSFTISGKPSWATFNTATGRLTGTPGTSDQGSFNNVVITVTNGKSSASLAPFNILVSAATMGSAALSWTPPTQNTDGTSLTNLAGYRIYYGTNAASLTSTIQITNPGLTSYTVGNLTSGTYYFAVAAYTTDGVEGAPSAVGSKTLM